MQEIIDASGPKYYAFDGNGSNKAYTGNNPDGTTHWGITPSSKLPVILSVEH